MCPVNWPGENQKGKSGGSFSWNSAWILKLEGSHELQCQERKNHVLQMTAGRNDLQAPDLQS